MKKENQIKIVFNRIFNKIFKVSNIEMLVLQKEKMEKTLETVNEEKNRIKGLLKVKQQELAENEINLQKIEKKISTYVNKEQLDKAKQGYEYKIQTEKEINRLKRDLSAYNQIINNTEKQIKIYEAKISKISNNIDELKAKEEFTKNAQKFRKNMSSLECKDIKDITQEINKEYYAENFALEDIEKQDEKTIDTFIQQDENDFLEYVERIKK